MRTHTIQALVENKFGVLSRISSLFSARGYNISSLAVGETLDPTVSCMTLVVQAEDEQILEQIKKQLNKLIDVITVADLTKKEHVDRELLLLRCGFEANKKDSFKKVVEKYCARMIWEDENSGIVEFTGDHHSVKEFLDACQEYTLNELVRTGKIAIAK